MNEVTSFQPANANTQPFFENGGSADVVHRSRPSQIMNIGFFLVGALKIALCLGLYVLALSYWNLSVWFALLPIAFFLFDIAKRVLQTHFIEYQIDGERITWRTGIFTKTVSTIEIFRIQNVTMQALFFERIFGIGTLFIETIDPTQPWVKLLGMERPEHWRQWLTHYVQLNRRSRGFQEFSANSAS